MKIGILGATGAVGEQMRICLEEQDINVSSLRLFASEKSAGKKLKFKNEDVIIEKIDENTFKGLDVVLGAVENDLAEKYAPYIVKSGAVFVDNSSAFRLKENVPLVVPEINACDIKKHEGIIANPNCVTIIALMGVAPIHKVSPVETMIATAFQAVSGAGKEGMTELATQMNKIITENIDMTKDGIGFEHNKFKHTIAYNLIPAIGGFDDKGFSSEEMKLQNEGRKILHAPSMKVNCTCVRIPIMRSHSISVSIATKEKLSLDKARDAIKSFPGVKLVDDVKNDVYPMPINTSNKDIVEVGRIREDLALNNGISLFVVGDQIRKGAATNAVQIIKEL